MRPHTETQKHYTPLPNQSRDINNIPFYQSGVNNINTKHKRFPVCWYADWKIAAIRMVYRFSYDWKSRDLIELESEETCLFFRFCTLPSSSPSSSSLSCWSTHCSNPGLPKVFWSCSDLSQTCCCNLKYGPFVHYYKGFILCLSIIIGLFHFHCALYYGTSVSNSRPSEFPQ